MAHSVRRQPARQYGRRGFSVAELLIVIGIMSVLLALLIPPLSLARRQAMQTHCAAELQHVGLGLEQARTEFDFYPYWDDGGAPIRYTWIDVLVQRRLWSGAELNLPKPGDPARDQALAELDKRPLGYCPADDLPDVMAAARHPELTHPLNRGRGGVDYSYGIAAPMSAGGWALPDRPGQPTRKLADHHRRASERVLAGDATDSVIYNLSGDSIRTGVWNYPTQYDNTVAWGRHAYPRKDVWSSNLLYQDGHVSKQVYRIHSDEPLNTARTFVWHPGESVYVGPEDQYEGNYYPNQLPPNVLSEPRGDAFPRELLPAWYTENHRWTRIGHK